VYLDRINAGDAMLYQSFSYLFPPRPEKPVPRDFFGYYEKKGWIGQAKKNGTCNVIAVSPDKTLICMNRHNADHGQWSPTKASSEAFRSLPGKGWFVFVAELLHSKIALDNGGVRDTNFINDILVHDGHYLVGETFADRQARIAELFLRPGQTEQVGHYVVDDNTWVAKNRVGDFKGFFAALDTPEDEGVVLKDPNSVLAICSREKSNVSWSVKSRRQHKNYGF
jgi:hypothetical protein